MGLVDAERPWPWEESHSGWGGVGRTHSFTVECLAFSRLL